MQHHAAMVIIIRLDITSDSRDPMSRLSHYSLNNRRFGKHLKLITAQK